MTARMFPEDITRVPMSVQALSGEFLERRDLSNLYDLQFEVPGLVLNNRGMFGAGISLRGVADEGGGGLSVAPHVNGVYLGRSTLALARQFDVERVEVVKGPQGTLYGRNATGGSLNVITRDSGAGVRRRAGRSVGQFRHRADHGHVNLPGESSRRASPSRAPRAMASSATPIDGRRFAEEDYYARPRLGARAASRSADDRRDAPARRGRRRERRALAAAPGSAARSRRHPPHDGDARRSLSCDDERLRERERRLRVRRADVPFHHRLRAQSHARPRRLRRRCRAARMRPRRFGPCATSSTARSCGSNPSADDSFDWLLGAYYVDGAESQNFHLNLAAPPVPIQQLHGDLRRERIRRVRRRDRTRSVRVGA